MIPAAPGADVLRGAVARPGYHDAHVRSLVLPV
jgi:hypothetical protein